MDYRSLIVGLDSKVSLADGRQVPAVNFDNASTTPPFLSVMKEINNFAPMYANIDGGQYQKAKNTEKMYEDARNIVLSFVNGDYDKDIVIFVKNTTEAINKLAYRLQIAGRDEMVLSTEMEHFSNDLPWRGKFIVDYVKVDNSGILSLEDLEYKLKKHQGRVKLVTLAGVSNVTGYVIPIHEAAKLAHKYGAQIHVDGAQLVPHVPVDMKPSGSPEHIDYLTFSAHKMYAPFGIGVLIGPRSAFENGTPEYSGGKAAKSATSGSIKWSGLPSKEEAGTPNIMGVIALTAAIKELSGLGVNNADVYEDNLGYYTIEKLNSIPDIHIYGDPHTHKIGIIPFNMKGFPHDMLAKVLAIEAGICVRNGNLSAQIYVEKLLSTAPQIINSFIDNYTPNEQGMVRISFAIYNTTQEIDTLIEILKKISGDKKMYFEKYLRMQ